MRKKRICPICGGTIEARPMSRDALPRGEAALYGRATLSVLACGNKCCGFGTAFVSDSAIYASYVCEEIRRRTRTMPADERASALLASLSYCKCDGNDKLYEQVNVIFMETLGEILKDARNMLRALSYRDPDAERHRAYREQLLVFMRFLARMQGHYPTPRLETEFYAMRRSLEAIDYPYELGMLALENDPDDAEHFFRQGMSLGGIRSKVAYVKYILAARAKTDEDREALKCAYEALASVSQEACFEYVCCAQVGRDNLAAILRRYAQETYETLEDAGKLAFIRLSLTVCTDRYEPMLVSLLQHPQTVDEPCRETARRILSELTALILQISDACETLRKQIALNEKGEPGSYGMSTEEAAERMAVDEENLILEYVIGCCMYFECCLDLKKRLDLRYPREAVAHFSRFLSSELFSQKGYGDMELPSLFGFLHLKQMRESARSYRRALSESVGLWGEL